MIFAYRTIQFYMCILCMFFKDQMKSVPRSGKWVLNKINLKIGKLSAEQNLFLWIWKLVSRIQSVFKSKNWVPNRISFHGYKRVLNGITFYGSGDWILNRISYQIWRFWKLGFEWNQPPKPDRILKVRSKLINPFESPTTEVRSPDSRPTSFCKILKWTPKYTCLKKFNSAWKSVSKKR